MKTGIGPESRFLPTPSAFDVAPRRNIAITFSVEKLEWCGYRMVKNKKPSYCWDSQPSVAILEHRIPMPELFTVRRFTRVLEAGKYGCPY